MSLLMDALKRAEQAREAQDGTSPADGQEASPAIPELSLDPLEVDNGDTGGFSLYHGSAQGPGGGDLSLEPSSTHAYRDGRGTGVDLFKIGAQPESNSTQTGEDTGEQELGLDLSEPEPNVAGSGRMAPIRLGATGQAEDTSATLPSLKSLRASVDSYFDGTESLSMSMEPVSPALFGDTDVAGATSIGSSAAGLHPDDSTTMAGKRLAEDLDAQRAAQNLFIAKQAQSSSQLGRFLLLFVLPLLLVAGLFGGGWYYIDIASAPSVVVRNVTRPAAAPRPAALATNVVPTPTPTALPAAAPARSAFPATLNPQPTAAAVLAQAAPAPGTAPTDSEIINRAKAALAATQAMATEGASAVGPSEPAPVADLSVKPPEPKIIEPPRPEPKKVAPKAPEPGLSDAQFAEALAKAEARLPRSAPRAGAIRIARSKPQARTEPQLQRGYQAFQRGDLRKAERAYNLVLRAQPNNRDALLGVAAVDVSRGNVPSAISLYQRILALDPQDSVAKAALFNLSQGEDAIQNVGQLKNMLAEEPRAAHLHFSLGNAYAEQGRWPEAQESYFSAFRYDARNADYAFNLAVSLDHLKQARVARDYYQRALSLAKGREVGFAVSAVRERIAAMSSLN